MVKDSQRWKPLLRHAEQTFAGSVLLASLMAIAIFFCIQRERGGGVIDLQQPHPHATVSFQVDVNSAGVAELRLLPGVGETIARRIADSRQIDGPYRSPNDLQRVRGIGPRTLERIQPYLLPIPPEEAVADR